MADRYACRLGLKKEKSVKKDVTTLPGNATTPTGYASRRHGMLQLATGVGTTVPGDVTTSTRCWDGGEPVLQRTRLWLRRRRHVAGRRRDQPRASATSFMCTWGFFLFLSSSVQFDFFRGRA